MMSECQPMFERDGLRLYRGDALRVLPELATTGVRIDMLATDPPYSSGGLFRGDRMLDVESKYVSTGTREARPAYGGDNRDQRSFLAWCTLWLAQAYDLARPGAIAAVFTDWRQLPTVTDALQAGGWLWRGIVPWDKTAGSRPRLGGYRAQCEYVVWGSAGPMRDEGHAGAGVLHHASPRGDRWHQAEKPLPVVVDLLRVVPAGGLVLDPFVGSGTTLVAARELGLQAVGIEIDPGHCATVAERLSQRVLPFAGEGGS